MQFFDWTLVRIRKIQLAWEIKNLGLLNLFYVFAFAVVFFFEYHFSKELPSALAVVGVLLLTVLGFHFSRRDHPFIQQHIEHPPTAIFWEYFSLYSIFTFPLFFTPHWYFSFLFWLGLFIVSHIKTGIKQRTLLSSLSKYVPPKYFEAISGLRQTFIPFFGIYTLAWAFCWVRGIPLFLLWFTTVIFTSFFAYCEPLNILRQTEYSTKRFLWKKVWAYSMAIFFLYFPICLINYLFNPELWYLNLIFIPLQIGLLAVAIFFKYAQYLPNISLKQNQTVVAINAMSALVPFLFPIPIFFGIIYYFRAKKKLKYFLHD